MGDRQDLRDQLSPLANELTELVPWNLGTLHTGAFASAFRMEEFREWLCEKGMHLNLWGEVRTDEIEFSFEASTGGRQRADLIVGTREQPDRCLIVETKVADGLKGEQLERYEEYCPEARKLVLAPGLTGWGLLAAPPSGWTLLTSKELSEFDVSESRGSSSLLSAYFELIRREYTRFQRAEASVESGMPDAATAIEEPDHESRWGSPGHQLLGSAWLNRLVADLCAGVEAVSKEDIAYRLEANDRGFYIPLAQEFLPGIRNVFLEILVARWDGFEGSVAIKCGAWEVADHEYREVLSSIKSMDLDIDGWRAGKGRVGRLATTAWIRKARTNDSDTAEITESVKRILDGIKELTGAR